MPRILTSSFQIEATPPFRLDYRAWCLHRRLENRMDLWDGGSLRSALMPDGIPHLIVVSPDGSPEEPLLDVTVNSRQKEEGLEDEYEIFSFRRR